MSNDQLQITGNKNIPLITYYSKLTTFPYLYSMESTFKIKGEYIELAGLLKVLGWAENGGMAHSMVDDQQITVNGEIELRKRAKLRPGDVVTFNGETVTME